MEKQVQGLNVDMQNDLHQIRLDARKISNKLYFLWETLKPMANESASGQQLSPAAIRGLCDQLAEMERKAGLISSSACRVLGMPEDTVEKEYA